MEARTAPQLSREGDDEPRVGSGLLRAIHLPARPSMRLRRPSAFVCAMTVVVLAVAFVAALTYYGAQEFTRRAADTRASAEAQSFAEHSSTIATGEAFSGYIQILRYADDPFVRSPLATAAERRAAMQRLLYLNTNRFESLAIGDRSGIVLASTDRGTGNLLSSAAYNRTRADLDPANSDILLPEAGQHGYVEFTAPLRLDDGAVWAILYGRADPERLWSGTLGASIDGGRNVIVNSEGQFSAGVPDDLLGQPWRGAPLANGSVRASIAGVDSICGLGTIGRETQIDHGWHVASCLPISLVQTEAARALGDQKLITVAGSVLALVIAGGLLYWSVGAGWRRGETEKDAIRTDDAGTVDAETQDEESEQVHVHVEYAAVPVQTTATAVADVDALTLVEAYERRNAVVAQRLRETVQARLMIATTELAEAVRLYDTNPESASALHKRALETIDEVREHELRAVSQELHPSLVRLGLPAALRTLTKELGGSVEITMDVRGDVDGVASSGGRFTIAPALRLILYRLVRDAIGAVADSQTKRCSLSLRRDGQELHLTIASPLTTLPDTAPIRASELGLQAFGGMLSVESTANGFRLTAEVPAPHVEQQEATEEPDDEGPIDAAVVDYKATTFVIAENAQDENVVAGDDEPQEVVGGEALEPERPTVVKVERLPEPEVETPTDDAPPVLDDPAPSSLNEDDETA